MNKRTFLFLLPVMNAVKSEGRGFGMIVSFIKETAINAVFLWKLLMPKIHLISSTAKSATSIR